jgi:hypothetical protein
LTHKISSEKNSFAREKTGEVIRKKVNRKEYEKFMAACRNGNHHKVVGFMEKFEL